MRPPGGLWKPSLIGQDWVPDSCLPYTGRQLLSDEHRWDLSGVVRHCPIFQTIDSNHFSSWRDVQFFVWVVRYPDKGACPMGHSDNGILSRTEANNYDLFAGSGVNLSC